MDNYRQIESKLTQIVGLTRRPVAISFASSRPEDVPAFEGTVPSGCSFWRLASEGRTFATVPKDHYNCPIGSYTHNIPLPPDRETELTGTLGFMTQIGYLRMEEVPGIPRLTSTPAYVVYAPLGEAPLPPDAVVLSARPGRVMLLIEAATRAGSAPRLPVLARPTCMSIPAAIETGVVTSAGCMGNRVYTDIGDDELYAVIRGGDLERVADALMVISGANSKLEEYHQSRRSQLLRI